MAKSSAPRDQPVRAKWVISQQERQWLVADLEDLHPGQLYWAITSVTWPVEPRGVSATGEASQPRAVPREWDPRHGTRHALPPGRTLRAASLDSILTC